MFNAVKTPLALAAIAFLSAACASDSMMTVPAVSTPAPVASTATPTIQAVPAGSYTTVPATYVTSQPTVYDAAQPALMPSAQLPAVAQPVIQPASTVTYSGTPAYQAAPLQTPGYAAPTVTAPSVTVAAPSVSVPGATAPANTVAGSMAENIAVQGANAAVNYGVNSIVQ